MSAADNSPKRARGGALNGIRVLDLSLLLPGPWATQILGDFGADVIKIESPRGDYTRHNREMALYPVTNRNKRSVVLDLKDEVCRQACLRIAATADVVVEGFRPGVVQRLGVSYEDLRKIRPDVIYCSISGYGQNGPLRDHPGHDGNYLAASGALSFSGHWLEPPRRSGIPVADLSSGMYAAVAILAAIHERRESGVGGYLDVSMTDTAIAFATVRAGSRLDNDPSARGHLFPTNDLFVTSDGVVLAIGVVEQHFWAGLREVVGPVDPAIHDERFADEQSRRTHGDELKAILNRVFASRPAADWMTTLVDHDVPVQRVLTVSEAVDSPQSRARGLTVDLDDGERQYLFPVLRDGEPMTGTSFRRAPELGAHTREVLTDVGCTQDEIEHCLTLGPS